MDARLSAKFPFLKEALEFAEENSADLESLLTSESFSPARARGRERVMDAIASGEVAYKPLMRDYDCLMEVMSYPYARMLVSVVWDRYLTKRYALGEAVRMNKVLSGEDHATMAKVSDEMGFHAETDPDGTMRMGFPDYLMLSSRMKSVDWKLINSDVRAGKVVLPADKFSRLMQNALQDKIESELPLKPPEELLHYLEKDAAAVKLALDEAKARMSPTLRQTSTGAVPQGDQPSPQRQVRLGHVHVRPRARLRRHNQDIRRVPGLRRVQVGIPDQAHHGRAERDGPVHPSRVQDHEDQRALPRAGRPLRAREPPVELLQDKIGEPDEEEGRGEATSPLLVQVPPCYDRPLHRGEVPDDGEPDHHDLQPIDVEPCYLEGSVSERRCGILDYREHRRQDHPVRASQQPRIQAGGADGLCLGAHVRGQEDANQCQHPQIGVAPGADRHSADHEHIGVPVEHVVEVISFRRGLPGQLGHLPVQGVEVP